MYNIFEKAEVCQETTPIQHFSLEERIQCYILKGNVFPTALPAKETKINKDAIYGPVIGVLALLLTASIINSVVKSHKRKY